ncbi:MAG: PBP1A family penicillin-binding protein [Clostridia bacterium]|nr:PBP1A family penicillin-binding protein [Clostridia bacterium]
MKIAALALLFVFLAGVLSAGVLASSLYLYMKNIDAELDIKMLAGNLGLTTKIYHLHDGEEAELLRLHGEENRIWADIADIPLDLQNAFIAIEDHRFYEHSGIDYKRTLGAVANFFGGKSYGGSTITQQLVKNLTGENQVTVKRKLTEIMRALELEKKLSKEEILELYLNNVYLSSGCFGVQTAAEKFFGKNAAELTLAECASLAAIVQNPSRYDPVRKPENNTERRNTVLARMYELGYISENEYSEAKAAPLTLAEQKESEPEGEIHSWFVDAVIEDVIAELAQKYGLSRSGASAMVYSGGLSIHTTLSADMQDMLDEFYKNSKNFPASEVGTPDSAAVIIDAKTGAVRAIAGGRGEKSANRAFCLATKAQRSPGSAIKPISVYAPAIEKNLVTWASVFDDVPVSITKTSGGYTLWPKNNPRVYSGLTTVNKAVYNSVNTVAVQVLSKVGLQNSFDFCKKAGLSGLTERTAGEGGKVLSDIAVAPLAMGATSIGVTVRDMAGAYTMFTRGGEFEKPYTFTAVYAADGTLLLSHGGSAERLISEESADIMTRLLRNVVVKGTATGMDIANKVEVAGKTGTSGSGSDKWFVGFTPEYVCGVWCGYRDGRDMGEYKENPACTVFDGIMGKVYKSLGSYEKRFTHSAGVVASSFCADSGRLASKACHADLRGGRIETGYFKRGTEPAGHCTAHMLVKYDKVTHAIACEKCPEENVINVGLLKVNRSFPCNVRITDAQYTYMYLPAGAEPALEENLPYFARLQKNGTFYGTSGVAKAKNRYCREHFLETTTEATTSPPPTKATAETTTQGASTVPPSSTVGETVTTPRTTSPTSPTTGDTRTTTATKGTTSAATTPQTTTGTASGAQTE